MTELNARTLTFSSAPRWLLAPLCPVFFFLEGLFDGGGVDSAFAWTGGGMYVTARSPGRVFIHGRSIISGLVENGTSSGGRGTLLGSGSKGSAFPPLKACVGCGGLVFVYEDTMTFFVFEFSDRTLCVWLVGCASNAPSLAAAARVGNDPAALRASSMTCSRSRSSCASVCAMDCSSDWIRARRAGTVSNAAWQ